MGYTHYFYTPKTLNKKTFALLAKDVKKIIDYCNNDLGIAIDGQNEKDVVLTSDLILFNGSQQQPKGVWTTNEQISIPWPSSTASLTEPSHDPIAEKTEGTWFAGDILSQRVAPTYEDNPEFADGSYETFYINRTNKDAKKGELYFNCCKTAYRPYDLAVTAVLIALKHHFPKCKVSTDGEEKDWLDGKILCNNILGYGMDFNIDE